MKDFMINNWQTIVIIMLMVIIAVILYIKRRDVFWSIVDEAVDRAEVYFSSGEGAQKKEYAINFVYQFLPKWLRIFITKEKIGEWVECAVIKLHSYIDGQYEKALAQYKPVIK